MSPPIPQIAVPALERACDDESLHVRVWAHGAMAMVTGQSDNHIRAIEAIVAQVPPNHEQAIFIRGDAARVIDLIRARSSKTP